MRLGAAAQVPRPQRQRLNLCEERSMGCLRNIWCLWLLLARSQHSVSWERGSYQTVFQGVVFKNWTMNGAVYGARSAVTKYSRTPHSDSFSFKSWTCGAGASHECACQRFAGDLRHPKVCSSSSPSTHHLTDGSAISATVPRQVSHLINRCGPIKLVFRAPEGLRTSRTTAALWYLISITRSLKAV